MGLVNDEKLNYFAQQFYGKVKENFDAKGSADTAEANAKAYADGLDGAMDVRVDALEVTVGDANSGLVKDVAVLKGDVATEGSVAYQIAQVVAGADASFDTLKEIADWIMNDTTGATAMANDIANLKALVGTIPEGATSTDIVNYIAEYVEAQLQASDLAQYAKAEDLTNLETRVKANEDAIDVLNGADTVEGSVAKAVKDGVAEANGYADGLNTAMDTRMTAVEGKAQANEDAIAVLNGTEAGSVAKAVADGVQEAKDYADGLAGNYATKEQGEKADACAEKIGVESDDANGVVATGIYARLEDLEAGITNEEIDDIIAGLQ